MSNVHVGHRYGVSPMNRSGSAYDPKRCAQPMHTSCWDAGRQCHGKSGWGTDGLFCWHHADVKKRFTAQAPLS